MLIEKFLLSCIFEEIIEIFIQYFNMEFVFLNIWIVVIPKLHPLFVRQLAHGVSQLILVFLILVGSVHFQNFQKLGLKVFFGQSYSLSPLFSLEYVILVNELNEVSSDYLEHVLAWRLLFFWP